MQLGLGEQYIFHQLDVFGLDTAAAGRAEGALARCRGGVVDAGEEGQAYLETASLATGQGLQHLGHTVFYLFHLGQANHQRPAQAFGQQVGQQPRAFAGLRLTSSEYKLGAGLAQVVAQHRQGIGLLRLFQHHYLFKAHA
ncbi:hypothetical protein D3C81_1594880 [compost metagenome]